MVASPVTISDAGIRKAAILVASLDRSAADAVLELLDPGEARRVRQTVVALDDIPAGELEEVLDEFARSRPGSSGRDTPGVELAGRLAREVGRSAANYNERETAAEEPCGRPFRHLCEAEGEKLARILSGERPQTIALVLSHLPPRQAGGILVRFPADLQVEVVRRLVDLEETDPAILREVEKALEARLSRQVQMQRRRVAGIEALNGILEESSSDVSLRIIDNLSAGDRKLARAGRPSAVKLRKPGRHGCCIFSGGLPRGRAGMDHARAVGRVAAFHRAGAGRFALRSSRRNSQPPALSRPDPLKRRRDRPNANCRDRPSHVVRPKTKPGVCGIAGHWSGDIGRKT